MCCAIDNPATRQQRLKIQTTNCKLNKTKLAFSIIGKRIHQQAENCGMAIKIEIDFQLDAIGGALSNCDRGLSPFVFNIKRQFVPRYLAANLLPSRRVKACLP